MTRSSRRSRLLRLLSLEDRSLPSSVQGTVFDDSNRDQIFDPGESGLSGWNVYVDNNQDGIQNPGEISSVTGLTGDFLIDVTSITPSGNGRNYLSLDLQVGSGGRWLPSTPLNVSVHPINEPSAVRDFGVYFEPYSSVESIGAETLVNVTTAGAQSGVVVDSDAAGNYVAAWESTSGGIDTVFSRVFNADGSPRTGEITVASAAGLGRPLVSMADNGRFAVGWSGNVPAYGKSSAYMRVYSSAGAPLTGPVTVIAATSKLHNWVTGVAMDADGDFAMLVSQTTHFQQGNHWVSSYPLQVQRYTAAGVATGKLIQVDDNRNFLGAGDPSMGLDDSGRFVVVWPDAPSGIGGVFAQRYSATGAKTGSLITVGSEPAPGAAMQPSVSMNSSGQFAITWVLMPSSNPSIRDTMLSVYQPTGTLASPTLTVASVGGAPNTIDDAGNVTFVWTTTSTSSSFYHREVHFRRVLAGGTLEPELLVNTTTQGGQASPTVAATGTNRFVVVWQGYGPGDDAGVFMQRFGPPVLPAAPPASNGDLIADDLLQFEFFTDPADHNPWE